MKNLWKRFKAILLAIMYVAIYILVSLGVQIVYMVWRTFVTGESLSEISVDVVNNAYALTIISVIIAFWIYLLIGSKRKCTIEKIAENIKTPPIVGLMAACCAVGLRMLVTVYYHYSQNVAFLKKSIDEASAITPELTGTWQMLIALFAIAIIIPMFEELLFRVLVMRELKNVMRSWAAIGLQAILFGVAHGVAFQSLFTFVIGIVLGIIYHRTKSFNAIVTCHGVFNLSVVMTLSELNLTTSIIVTVLGLLLVGVSLFYILENSKKHSD